MILVIKDGIVNVNNVVVYFQNIFLAWTIWQPDYDGELSSKEIITAIIILIWALIDIINAYFALLYTSGGQILQL